MYWDDEGKQSVVKMQMDQSSETHPSIDSVFGGIVGLWGPYRILSVSFSSCVFDKDAILRVSYSPTSFLHPNLAHQTQRMVFWAFVDSNFFLINESGVNRFLIFRVWIPFRLGKLCFLKFFGNSVLEELSLSWREFFPLSSFQLQARSYFISHCPSRDEVFFVSFSLWGHFK